MIILFTRLNKLNIEKVNALIQLARKGRMIEIGNTAVNILLERKRASLVIVATDASEKLKRQIELACIRRNVPIYIFNTKVELGKICDRESVGVIAISDKNLAKGIKAALS